MNRFIASLLFATIVGTGGASAAQEPVSAQTQFDAGRYTDAISAAQQNAAPDMIYLTGRSYLRINELDQARAEFARLTSAPAPWALVGESATVLIDGNTALAIEKASQAAAIAPDHFHAHYQLGLAHSAAEQWEPAAAAFEKAASIDPASAYAHYYAGLAYSRLRQLDRMATHLEYFLKLAPEAPERAAVMSLMRSVRGL